MSRKRVSYSLATPDVAPPELGLPDAPSEEVRPFGPRYHVLQPNNTAAAPAATHPTHCLGVTALALDTTTVLHGSDSPRGILYTGGRDGLVASWEQGVPMRPASAGRSGEEEYVKWERIGVFDSDTEDEEDEDEEFGFINARHGADVVRPTEQEGTRWTVDREAIRGGSLGVSARSSSLPPVMYELTSRRRNRRFGNHSKLIPIGSMIYCSSTTDARVSSCPLSHYPTILQANTLRLPQVITASSDRSIRAWQPHHADRHDQPALVGVHRDYVKCLAFA